MNRLTLVCLLGAGVALSSCGGKTDRAVINNKGSDTTLQVAQLWAEKYKEVDPEVAVSVSGGGSGTGITALIDGRIEIANASRKMKASELEAAKKNGVEPKEFVVGWDALAVYVHKDNPIESITLAQLAEIYGEGGKTEKWSQLGVQMEGQADEIILVSRMNNSGTYDCFKKATLGGQRDYKGGTRDQHGSKDVVDLVAHTPGAIGYSGLAYATDEVKMVPVRKTEGGEAVSPSVTTASDGTYPIARPLLMYSRGEPTGKTKEYLDWIMGDAGQKILVDEGYAPIK